MCAIAGADDVYSALVPEATCSARGQFPYMQTDSHLKHLCLPVSFARGFSSVLEIFLSPTEG